MSTYNNRRWVGTFDLSTDAEGMRTLCCVGVSGNAKQRRLYVRRWKRMGYTVTQWKSEFNCANGAGVSYN